MPFLGVFGPLSISLHASVFVSRPVGLKRLSTDRNFKGLNNSPSCRRAIDSSGIFMCGSRCEVSNSTKFQSKGKKLLGILIGVAH